MGRVVRYVKCHGSLRNSCDRVRNSLYLGSLRTRARVVNTKTKLSNMECTLKECSKRIGVWPPCGTMSVTLGRNDGVKEQRRFPLVHAFHFALRCVSTAQVYNQREMERCARYAHFTQVEGDHWPRWKSIPREQTLLSPPSESAMEGYCNQRFAEVRLDRQ